MCCSVVNSLLCVVCNLQTILKDTWPTKSHCGPSPAFGMLVAIYPLPAHSTGPRRLYCVSFLSQAVSSALSDLCGTEPPPPPCSCMVTPPSADIPSELQRLWILCLDGSILYLFI